jgi:hypothetical protein
VQRTARPVLRYEYEDPRLAQPAPRPSYSGHGGASYRAPPPGYYYALPPPPPGYMYAPPPPAGYYYYYR